MSELVCYSSDQIRAVWPVVSPLLAKAPSNCSLREIYKGLRREEMQLWTSNNNGHTEAALVTALHDDYCLLLAAGGENLNDWVGWLPFVEDFARSKGMKELKIIGRIGWLRKLKGFEAEMVKQLWHHEKRM